MSVRLPLRRRRARSGRLAGFVPALAVVALAVVTVLDGYRRTRGGADIGAPLPPFAYSFEPGVGPFSVVSAAVLALGVVLAPRLRRPELPALGFALAATTLALALRLAVAASRNGASGWYAVLLPNFSSGKNEYLPALPSTEFGARLFLDRFAETLVVYPVHPAGHPPGLLLVMHLLGIDSAQGTAALLIGAGVLSVPLAYLLGRRLLDEPRARLAALLYAFSPSAVLHGATSADALFATFGLLAAVGLVARERVARLAGPAALAVASFFSYALLAIGAWGTFVVLLRDGWRPALRLAALCALALVAFYAGLWALTGFDLVGALRSTDEVYRASIARIRPYSFWILGSPVAWLVALGPPIAWYAVRAVGAGRSFALALAAVVVVSAVSGFSKGETERIWLFLVPLACLAAASVLPERRLTPVLALLALQAFLVEHLLATIW